MLTRILLCFIACLLLGCGSRPVTRGQVRVTNETERAEFLQLAVDELAKHELTGKLSDSSDVLAVSSIQGATHLSAGEIMTPANQVRPWSVTFHVSSFDGGAKRVVQIVQTKIDGRVVNAAPVVPVAPTNLKPVTPVPLDPTPPAAP